MPPQGGETPAAGWVPPTWEEVVEQHSARVYRLAYRLTGNVHDAEDLTQDVFVRVFRSLHTYQPGTFEGWLHRITTNVFLDKMRRKQRIRFDALSDESAARLPARGPGPEQIYHDAHFDDDVQRALDALSPDFRAAVVLCDIEGLSYEEVAATLGIKLGTVRSRIHRGRAQLRESLAHRAPQPSTTATPTKSRGRIIRRPAAGDRMTDAMRVQCQGEELTEYAAGRLPVDRQWAWDRHLVACQICAHDVAQERRLRSALAGAPSMPGRPALEPARARGHPRHRPRPAPGAHRPRPARPAAPLGARRATAAPCARPSSPPPPPGCPRPPRGASPSPRPVGARRGLATSTTPVVSPAAAPDPGRTSRPCRSARCGWRRPSSSIAWASGQNRRHDQRARARARRLASVGAARGRGRRLREHPGAPQGADAGQPTAESADVAASGAAQTTEIPQGARPSRSRRRRSSAAGVRAARRSSRRPRRSGPAPSRPRCGTPPTGTPPARTPPTPYATDPYAGVQPAPTRTPHSPPRPRPHRPTPPYPPLTAPARRAGRPATRPGLGRPHRCLRRGGPRRRPHRWPARWRARRRRQPRGRRRPRRRARPQRRRRCDDPARRVGRQHRGPRHPERGHPAGQRRRRLRHRVGLGLRQRRPHRHQQPRRGRRGRRRQDHRRARQRPAGAGQRSSGATAPTTSPSSRSTAPTSCRSPWAAPRTSSSATR